MSHGQQRVDLDRLAMLGIPSEGGGRTFESCRVHHTGSSVEMEAKEKIATDGGADRRTPLRTEPGYGVADDCQSRFRPQDQLRVAKVSDCDAIGLAAHFGVPHLRGTSFMYRTRRTDHDALACRSD